MTPNATCVPRRFGSAWPGTFSSVKLGTCPCLSVPFPITEREGRPATGSRRENPRDTGFDAVKLEGFFSSYLTVTTTYGGAEFDRYNGMRKTVHDMESLGRFQERTQ